MANRIFALKVFGPKMRLTKNQISVLYLLRHRGRSTTMFASMAGIRTVRSLVAKGLIRYFPYGNNGRGSYALTREGQDCLIREDQKDEAVPA
jgi:predicted transcriptional regulator